MRRKKVHLYKAGRGPVAPRPEPRNSCQGKLCSKRHGAYLWVFIVTFPMHEISNKCLILVDFS